MSKLETVNAEIEQLQQQQTTIQQDYKKLENDLAESAEMDESKFLQFPSMEVAMRVIGKRLGLLQEDKAALERENQFAEYEQMTKGQYEYYVSLDAKKERIQALRDELEALIKECSDMEAENHGAKFKRVHLRHELSQHDRTRVAAIDKPYQFKVYM